MFDYIIIIMRMYGIILTNNITQIYVICVLASIVKQLQANLTLAIRLPMLPSPNIKAKKKGKKKNLNKPCLNYTNGKNNVICRQQMIHTSHQVIISIA